MKTRVSCFLGLLLAIISQAAYGQQYSAFPAAPYQNLYKSFNSSLTVAYYETINLFPFDPNAYVGRNDTYTPDDFRRRESFRMVYRWDVSSIPDYAAIDGATLVIDWYSLSNKSGASNVKFFVKKFPAEKWSAFSEEKWNAVKAAAKYDSVEAPLNIPRYGAQRNFSRTSTFCTDIKNSLPGNYFYLSLQTDDDTVWTTGSGTIHQVDIERGQDRIDLGIQLTINYHIPNYNVTVKNNYPGGSVYIDDTLYTNVPSSGITKSWLGGTSHSVRAIDGQVVDGFTWSYTNWTNTIGQTVAQNPNTSYSFQVTGDATYTANYTRKFVVSGTFTVASGQTRTFGPDDQILFEPGAKMLVYGTLLANGNSGQRITITRSGSTGEYQGIEFNGSNNSSLQYCDILYATMPIKATNTSNLTISNVTIGNSSFYNGTDNAAMAFYNSSPTISNVTINGQSNSWNGLRFAQGSTGIIQYSTIQNCGAGNGIVVQGNSSPQILGNTIRSNYYHGIIVVSNGTGNPVITGNTVESNGIVNGNKRYNGINFYYSAGKVVENTVRYNNFGVYCDSYSSPSSSHGGQGRNLLTANRFGILVHNNSNPTFGVFNSSTNQYFGACNKILANDEVNAKAQYSSTLWAQGTWWGADPPDASRIVAVENSWIEYSYWRPYDDNDCLPGGGLRIGSAGQETEAPSLSASVAGTVDPVNAETDREILYRALLARLKEQYGEAVSLYRAVLAQSTLLAHRQRALVGLFEVWRDAKDPSVLAEIGRYRSTPGTVGLVATELLMQMYASTGRFDEAKSIALGLAQKHKNSETEQRALIVLASLAGFSESQRSIAQQYRTELAGRYASSVDWGLLTALGGTVAEGSPKILSGETAQPELSVSNFPNPFNPSTVIQFTLPEAGHVSLKVFDLLGREVATLVNEHRPAGSHQVVFNASTLPSGMYFYRLDAAGALAIQKMVLAR